jgi:hypothetical protein
VSSLAATAPAQARRAWRVASEVRPAYVLAPLLGIQWLAVLVLALTVRHNGWLYYAGGDQLWHYTGAYLLAHGHLPPAYVGYGWSVLLAPVAAIAGPNLVSALPAMVLFNTLVLLPVALLCIYGIGARIAGRIFGYFAAALWIAMPYLGILFVLPGYHQKYTELTLPQLLGLTSVPDFPSTVALIVAAYLCLVAVDSAGWQPAALAGLAAGYSIAMKPSNVIFLVAPGLLLLVERRREALSLAAGLAMPILTLAIWKYRGLGELAAAPAEPMRLASGPGLLDRIHGPRLNSWAHLHTVLLGFREHFWIARVIEWLPLAGLVGLLARSRRGLLIVGAWFVVYLLLKGTYIPASIDDASFFRIMMPAFPAYVLLAGAVLLLVPGVRVRPATVPLPLAGRRLTVAVAAAFGLFAIVPFGVVAAVPRLHDGGQVAVHAGQTLIPVSSSPQLHATVSGDTVQLSWRDAQAGPAAGFYHVLRANASADVACAGRLNGSSDNCALYTNSVTTTTATSFTDRPGAGTWTYRLGIAANWVNDPSLGDVYVVSKPVTATVG